MKLLSFALYVVVFLPIWAFVRFTGLTRFGRRYHRRGSTWDRPVASPANIPATAPARFPVRTATMQATDQIAVDATKSAR